MVEDTIERINEIEDICGIEMHFDTFCGLNGTLENGTPVIVINRQISTELKRFTALHELGHALLHFPENMDEKMEGQNSTL